jgi:Rubisco Assembly chaperone C-terminal domain/Rubisco accumulation factor 1 alpha helical domain/Rubisco accumulation factor 1 helix turn helix domain
MTDTSNPNPSPAELEELGKACATLQKMGYSSQKIFEETGFEPIQQNQVTVAAQVYTSLVQAGVEEEVRSHFNRTGSDTLYEFRILTQPERATAAAFVLAHRLDSEAAKDVAKAIKEFSRFRISPEGFSNHPGDAMAYMYWKLAKQQSDLAARSRLIANGLRFANSDTARQQVEKLLMDFTVTPKRPAPILPFYRLDSDEELPRILPVAGKLPLGADDIKAVPMIEETGAFQVVEFSGKGAWVAVPGWKVVLAAEDPVGVLCDREALASANRSDLSNSNNIPADVEFLVIVDRAERDWDANSYFLVAQDEQVQIQWLEEESDSPLLGKVILVLRPKRLLDENLNKDVWQIDE